MSKSVGADILLVVWSVIMLYMLNLSISIDQTSKSFVYIPVLFLLVLAIIAPLAGFANKKIESYLSGITLFIPIIMIYGVFQGGIIGVEGPWDEIPFPGEMFNNLIFPYHVFFTFVLFLAWFTAFQKVEGALSSFLTIPVLIVAMGAHFLVFLIDLLFPPKIQELVPYIDALRTLILNIANVMADPARIEAELALESLGDLTGAVEDIGEGYALRKSLGQGIDIGLTLIVFIGLGGLRFMEQTLHIDPLIIGLFFASLGLALATFSGFFGPFYGLAEAAKEFSLKHGNYRGASFYKSIEQVFAIPFMAASAGFLFLDLPPVDGDTLEDFKKDMREQIEELSDNINSLLGKNASAVPRKTRKMIASLMTDTEDNLAKLDFRNMRKETARQFALSYYQHEFSWKPWKRKTAVKEFATQNHFDYDTGEDTLKLIGYKIEAGQMDDDMVNNVMITAALRGVIMMEEKFQNILNPDELGQTCTGLAFGARQFLEDHYIVRSTSQKLADVVRNFVLGIFAVPIVLMISFNTYINRIFNMFGESVWNQQIGETTTMRYKEIHNNFSSIPSKIRTAMSRRPKTKEEKKEKRERRKWEIRRRTQVLFGKILEVLWFPFKVVIGTFKFIRGKIKPEEANPRDLFEEAVAHAALVSMYGELYNKLVKQDHVTSGF